MKPARDTTPPRWLGAHNLIVGLLFVLPAVFVFVRAAQLGTDLGETIGSSLAPLGRTIVLATAVSLSACVLGTALAWILDRTDIARPGAWRVALMMPLVLPSFVGAAAFLAAIAPGGLLHGTLTAIGIEPKGLRGFWPSWALLTLFTYPYVFLSVGARLESLRPALEESARLLGSSAWSTFFNVTLPQLRLAIASSGLLVFLYTVSEFGAVQLLGYDTLTRVIYATRLVDRGVSFSAAALLLLLALSVVALERRYRGASTGSDDETRQRFADRMVLKRSKGAVYGLLIAVALFSFVAPVASLATWAARGLADGRIDLARLVSPAFSTIWVGVITSLVAIVVVLPLAIGSVRYKSQVNKASSSAVVAGFAIPGLVIALSLVFWTLKAPVINRLYQTLPLLVFAYVIHFGSQVFGAAEGSVRAVPQSLRESSQLLETSRWRRVRNIQWPLMKPGLTSGGGLVLLATTKELPATLLLAPIGFKTLATEVWSSYEEGFFAEVGVASLLLLTISAVLTWWLVLRPVAKSSDLADSAPQITPEWVK